MRRYLLGAGALAAGAAALVIAMWPRPTVTPTPTRPLLASLDQRQPAYLARHSQPWMTKPAAATTFLHCPMSDLGGGAHCVDQDGTWVKLTSTGTPVYQAHTSIPAKGQSRRGVKFRSLTDTTGDYVAASSNSILSLNAETYITIEALVTVYNKTASSSHLWQHVVGSSVASTAGWGMNFKVTEGLVCDIYDGSNRTYYYTSTPQEEGKTYHFVCVFSKVGGTWQATAGYINATNIAGTKVNAATGDISNAQPVTIGRLSTGGTTYPLASSVLEVVVSSRAYSDSDVLARYRQSIYNGTHWTDDANTLAHYKMTETSITSGLADSSGHSNNLTSVSGQPEPQYGIPPFPIGSGFSRRGILTTDGDANYLVSTTPVAKQTTNDFSVSFWHLFSSTTGQGGLVFNVASKGYMIRPYVSDVLWIWITDGGGTTSGAVSDAGIVPNTWHFYTVNYDRSGNAYAFIDGVQQTATVDISSRSGDISDSSNMYLFRHSAASNSTQGALAELMISNGLTTLAEHQAMYRAFKKPTEITSYAQGATSIRKFPLPPEEGFGDRLGVFAGSTTSPQWPVTYSPKLSTKRTNWIGYAKELDQWTRMGGLGALTANAAVDPDGVLAADRVSFTANAQYLVKTTVGAGAIDAGEWWCASIYYKVVSGTCTGVVLTYNSNGADVNVPFGTSTTWARNQVCGQMTYAKGMMLYANTHGSCVMDIVSAQYERNVVSSRCTSTSGDVIQTCDDGTNTSGLGFPAWGSTTNVMGYTNQFDSWSTSGGATVSANTDEAPDGTKTADQMTHAAAGYIGKNVVGGGSMVAGERWCGSVYAKKISGTCAYLCLNVEGGGATSAPGTGLVTGRWVRATKCVTGGTNPKAVYIQGATTAACSAGTDCVVSLADAQYESGNVTPPCTSTAGDASQTCDQTSPRPVVSLATMPTSLERGELVVSAALGPFMHQPTVARRLARVADSTAILDEGALPKFTLNGLGGYQDAVAKGRTIGHEEERREYIASWDYRDGLPQTGITRWSWNFARASSQAVKASSTSVANPGSATALTVEALVKHTSNVTSEALVDTAEAGTYNGYSMYTSSSGEITCTLRATNTYACTSTASLGSLAAGAVHHAACTWDKTGSDWNAPKIFVDGILVGMTCSGTTPTGSLVNGSTLSVGGFAGVYSDANIYEVRILTKALTSDEVKADWVRSRSLGATWIPTTGELAHYTFGEATTGSGLLDDSGNGNHLTVVTGTPTARYAKLPWPDGGNRRYAGLRVNGKWAHTVLEPAPLSASMPSVPASTRNQNSSTARIGCDSSGQCLNGTIERFEWWGRPAQTPDVVPDDPTRLVVVDFSDGAYATAQDTPRFAVPSGTTAAKTWIWDMTEASGKPRDRINGVELTVTGTPRYQAWTGLWARGAGRKALNFDGSAGGAACERIKTTDTSKVSLNGSTGVTFEWWSTNNAVSSNGTVFDTRGIGNSSGFGAGWISSSATFLCAVNSSTNQRGCYATSPTDGKFHHYACVATYGGSDWTWALYVDGEAVSCTPTGSATSNTIPNAQGFSIAATSDSTTGYCYDGVIGEVRIRNTADSASTIKAHYRQSVEQGTYWTDDQYTVAHYFMNDYAAGTYGLSDYSGNGNHLTSITGTPDTDQRMPWPMGSGVNRRSIQHSGGSGNSLTTTSSSIIPSDQQNFTVATWIRETVPYARMHYPWIVDNGGSAPRFVLYTSSGTASFQVQLSGGTSTASGSGTTTNDGVWHLVVGKVQYTGGSGHRACISMDGGAYSCGSYVSGSAGGAAANTAIHYDGSVSQDNAGMAIFKDYALTEAEISALWKQGADPTGKLTYVRADKVCMHADRDPIDGIRVKCYKSGQIPHCWDMDGPGEQLTGEVVSQQITNYAYYSEQVDQWTPSGVTVTANDTESPDGMKTADALVEDATTGTHYVSRTDGSSVAGDVRTCVLLKKSLRSWAVVEASDGSATANAYYNLADCTIGTTYSSCSNRTTMGIGGGWCRACFTWTASAGRTFVHRVYAATADGTNSYSGSNGSTALWAWGYRLNIPAKPQPYCPTDGAATAACGNITSNYVAAAHLTGWNRTTGTVAALGIATADSVIVDIWNGSSNAGKHRLRPWNWGAAIWDSGGTLSQNASGGAPSTGTQRFQVVVFDSSTPFYSATTRRLYSHQLAETYGGPAYTYGTDVGLWTPVAGTSLYIGTISSYLYDGVVGGVWIWNDR